MSITKYVKQEDLLTDTTKSISWVVFGIDGHLDRLQQALDTIENSKMFTLNDEVVFLGNIVGNGPDTMNCLHLLDAYAKLRPNQVTCVRGPNEQQFIEFQKDFCLSDLAKNIFASYHDGKGTSPKIIVADSFWVENFPCLYATNRYAFVYGGLDKNKQLFSQELGKVMFLTNEKLTAPAVFDKTIVNVRKVEKVTTTSNLISLPSEGVYGVLALNDTTGDKMIEHLYTKKVS